MLKLGDGRCHRPEQWLIVQLGFLPGWGEVLSESSIGVSVHLGNLGIRATWTHWSNSDFSSEDSCAATLELEALIAGRMVD